MPFPGSRRGRGRINKKLVENVVKQAVGHQGGGGGGSGDQQNLKPWKMGSEPPFSSKKIPHYEDDPLWSGREEESGRRGGHSSHHNYHHEDASRPPVPNPRGSWGRNRRKKKSGRGKAQKGKTQADPPLVLSGIPHLEHSFVMNKPTTEGGNYHPNDCTRADSDNGEGRGGRDLEKRWDERGMVEDDDGRWEENQRGDEKMKWEQRQKSEGNERWKEEAQRGDDDSRCGNRRRDEEGMRMEGRSREDEGRRWNDRSEEESRRWDGGQWDVGNRPPFQTNEPQPQCSRDSAQTTSYTQPPPSDSQLNTSDRPSPPATSQSVTQVSPNSNINQVVGSYRQDAPEGIQATSQAPNSDINQVVGSYRQGSSEGNQVTSQAPNSGLNHRVTGSSVGMGENGHQGEGSQGPTFIPASPLNLKEKATLEKETERYYDELMGSKKTQTKESLSASQVAKITKEYKTNEEQEKLEEEQRKEQQQQATDRQSQIETAWSVLHHYWQFVRDNPYDFNGWTYLLNHVETMDNIEAARSACDGFLPLYPYCFAYWKKLGDMEMKHNEAKRCLGVLLLGTECVPLCVDLWLPLLSTFITYTKDNNLSPHCIRSLYESGLESVGGAWRSSPLWDACINYEQDHGDLVAVMALYRRLICTPLKLYNKHWDHFLALVRDHHPRSLLPVGEYQVLRRQACEELGIRYTPTSLMPPKNIQKTPQPEDKLSSLIKEKIVASYIKTHETNEQEVNKRWKFEERIKRPYFHVKSLDRKQIKNWNDYLDFEMGEGDPMRIVTLFERCLVACALYEELWIRYALYLETHVQKVMDKRDREMPNIYDDKGTGDVEKERDKVPMQETKQDNSGSEKVTGDSEKVTCNVDKEGESSVALSGVNREVIFSSGVVGDCVVVGESGTPSSGVSGRIDTVKDPNDKSKNQDDKGDYAVPGGGDSDDQTKDVEKPAAVTPDSGDACKQTIAVNVEVDKQRDPVVTLEGDNKEIEIVDSEGNKIQADKYSETNNSSNENRTVNSECTVTAEEATGVEQQAVPLTMDQLRYDLCAYLSLNERVLKCPPLTPEWIENGVSWEDVRHIYRRGVWIHCPSKPALLMQWAEFEETQGNLDTARELLNTVTAKHPSLLKARMQMIELERRAGNLSRVEQLYGEASRAITHTRERSWLAIRFARFLFKILLEPDRALVVLRKALKKDRGNTHLYHHVFDICYQRQPVDTQGVLASVLLALSSKELSAQHKYWFSYKRVEFLKEHGDIVELKQAQQELVELKREADKEANKMKEEEEKNKGDNAKEGTTDKNNSEKENKDKTGEESEVGGVKEGDSSATPATAALTATPADPDPSTTQQLFPVPYFSADGGITYNPMAGYGYGHSEPGQPLPTAQEVVATGGDLGDAYHNVPQSWGYQPKEGGYGYGKVGEDEWPCGKERYQEYSQLLDGGYPSHLRDKETQELKLPFKINIDHLRRRPEEHSLLPHLPDLSQPPPSVLGGGSGGTSTPPATSASLHPPASLPPLHFSRPPPYSSSGPPGLLPLPSFPLGQHESSHPQGERLPHPHHLDHHRHSPFDDHHPYNKRRFPHEFGSGLDEPPYKSHRTDDFDPSHQYRPEYDTNYTSSPGPSAPPSHRATLAYDASHSPRPDYPPYDERRVHIVDEGRERMMAEGRERMVDEGRERMVDEGRERILDEGRESPELLRFCEVDRYSIRDPETIDAPLSKELELTEGPGLCVNVPEWLMMEGGELRLSHTDAGASIIRYWPHFMTDKGEKAVFRILRKGLKWHQRRAVGEGGQWQNLPHLLSWVGPCSYSYSGLTLEKNSHWLPEIVDLLHRLIQYTGNQYNSCFLTLFRNGYDHVPWAQETHPALRHNPSIAVVSLGTTRIFEMQRKNGPGFLRFPLYAGSLLLMEGATQEDWEHQFPKEPNIPGERIHMTFRKLYMIKGLTV